MVLLLCRGDTAVGEADWTARCRRAVEVSVRGPTKKAERRSSAALNVVTTKVASRAKVT